MTNEDFLEKLRQNALSKYAPTNRAWCPPEEALFGQRMIYNVEKKKAEELRLKAIKYAFKRCYEESPFYHKFCKTLEIEPSNIKSEQDYVKIPLLSDLLFKDHPDAGKSFIEWLSKIFVGKFPKQNIAENSRNSFDSIINAAQKENIALLFSSSTSGNFSFIPRDAVTWNRQMYVCSRIFEMSRHDFSAPNSTVIWLGPEPNNTHLYIGRLTMMLADLFENENVHFWIKRKLTTKAINLLMGTDIGFTAKIKSGLARPIIASEQNKGLERLIDVLDKNEKMGAKIAIGGTPFFVDLFISKIEGKGLKFNIENGMVVTAGGWKTFVGNEIPGRLFRERVNKILGIPPTNCRDIYGMVECNALSLSCEGHYKHVPHSVIYPMVLDEESEPVGFGEYGRFAFLDSLANSYPGFIMTGDKVKLLDHCPVCDKPGPVICEDISRFGGVQDRGCGATLAKMFSEEVEKTCEGM